MTYFLEEGEANEALNFSYIFLIIKVAGVEKVGVFCPNWTEEWFIDDNNKGVYGSLSPYRSAVWFS